jgi:hypothetical protein
MGRGSNAASRANLRPLVKDHFVMHLVSAGWRVVSGPTTRKAAYRQVMKSSTPADPMWDAVNREDAMAHDPDGVARTEQQTQKH